MDHEPRARKKLFFVALFAAKQEERLDIALNTVSMNVGLDTWATEAETDEEAYDRALQKAKDLWPTRDGWGGHAAKAAEIHMQSSCPTINVEDYVTEERIM